MSARKICVIGGGASGLTAAVCAARAGANVTVLEHMDRVGKKLLSTGNGRCNYTNASLSAERYFSGSPETVAAVLRRYPAERVVLFLESIGVVPFQKDGYYYPASGQAASVLSCFLAECAHRQVEIRCGVTVREIRRADSGFFVRTDETGMRCDALILACGGQAAPSSGSDGSGYALAESLGHTIRRPFPALTPLKAEPRRFKPLAGVRVRAEASLYIDGRFVRRDAGEVQFTEGGLSGIVVFQLSHLAVEAMRQKRKAEIRLNFLPDMSSSQAASFFARRRKELSYQELAQWGIGLFPKKLWMQMIREAGLPPTLPVRRQEPAGMAQLQAMTLNYRVPLMGYFGFERAQVSAGGVDLAQVHSETMESCRAPGLYLCGELLDVDGLCGGYNLHWAWATGMTAAAAACRGADTGRRRPSHKE